MKKYLCIFILILIMPIYHLYARDGESVSISLPDIKRVQLKPYGKIKFTQIFESSGIVKSREHQNVYWTHNDSGDIPRIFPVTRDGNIIKPRWAPMYNGIIIQDAVNNDWEDITVDNGGNLIIGDIGNNNNDRKNFQLYKVREPSPYEPAKVKISQEIRFYYPEEKEKKLKKENVNAEAIFWARSKIYILTKAENGKWTYLYCLESFDTDKSNPLSMKGSFNFQGDVTGADASEDGKRLAVLSYNGVWLFETSDANTDYFEGKISWLPIRAGQCEGICIDNEDIIISNETRELFSLSIHDLILVKE